LIVFFIVLIRTILEMFFIPGFFPAFTIVTGVEFILTLIVGPERSLEFIFEKLSESFVHHTPLLLIIATVHPLTGVTTINRSRPNELNYGLHYIAELLCACIALT